MKTSAFAMLVLCLCLPLVHAEQKPDEEVIAPLGTEFNGKFENAGRSQDGTAKVISRNGKKMTIQLDLQNGSQWEFDCEFSKPRGSKEYKIVGSRIPKPANGVKGPLPVGGITGKGRISGSNLKHSYTWKRPNEKPLELKFAGDVQKTPE